MEIVFSEQDIDFPDLNDLLEKLEPVSGKKLEIERRFVVSTDDRLLTNILGNIRSRLLAKRQDAKPFKKNRQPTLKIKAVEMGAWSMRMESTGIILSTRELKTRLAEGTIEENAVLINSKGVRFIVMGKELVKEPQP